MAPLEIPYLEKIFHCMLITCKITKFKEVNYKILSRILLTPKMLSRIVTEPELQWCVWCGAEASLEHILLTYLSTVDLHSLVMKIAFCDNTIISKSWIFGITCQEKNPIIWLTNFAIYKCHLRVCNGSLLDLQTQFLSEYACYEKLYPSLSVFSEYVSGES